MKELLPSTNTFSVSEPLMKSEAFKLVLNNLEDYFLLLDTDLRVVLTSEATKARTRELWGKEIKEGMSVFSFAAPERNTILKALYAKVLKGAVKTTETKINTPDGTHYFENHFKPAKNCQGDIVGVIVSSRDITEKKQQLLEKQKAEERLKKSEQHYKALFQNNPLPCWIYDSNTLLFLEVNTATIEHYGYSKEEFLKLSILDIQAEAYVNPLKEKLKSGKNGKRYSINNWQHKTKDGRNIFVDLRIEPINYKGIEARLVVAHDVTSKVITENELRQSNERFKLAAKASSEALWEWDFVTEEAYISSTYTDMLGWKADEFRKFDKWPDYIHPDDKTETTESYDKAVEETQAESWEKEYRYLKSDGSYAHVHDKAVFVRDEQGKAIKVVGALQDITGFKKVEEALRKSNESFLLASRAASDALYDWDLITNELQWGEGLKTLFGFDSPEVPIGRWEKLIHPKDKDRIVKSISAALANREIKFWKEEYLFSKSDGSFRYVLDRGFILRNDAGEVIRMIGSMQDMTDRKFNERLLSLERTIFESSVNPDIPLKGVVETLLKGIEELYPEMIASVLLLKEDDSVEHLAPLGLPTEFILGIKGSKIGPNQGSSGTALYLKETVIVPDIENDPLWVHYKELALRCQLKACWAFPIVHASGRIIGSLTIYLRKPQSPDPAQLATIERLRNILRIVMENRWSLQEIKIANERFDIVMKATHDLIWDWNLETNMIYRDAAGLRQVYGIDNNSSIETLDKWLERIHPDDYKKVEKVMSNIFRSVREDKFDVEYRFKRADGTYSHVYDRGVIIRNEQGKPVRMIGAAQDISERKRLEKELLTNELEHQKAINQATVDSQEQERTEIGKELHDNVNQVLTTTKLYLDLARSNPDLKDELIEKSTKNILSVINEIRQLSRSLMNPSIGDLGLIDSIHDLIENINLTRKLHVSLKADPVIEDLLDKSQKLTVFRIIQEGLNNAIKHSKATLVTINFAFQNNTAEVIIEDNGIGFNVQTVKKGAGLKNIQNRIYLIGGWHAIKSKPGAGSKLVINFPIIHSNTEQSN
jgi:PAS domain S-box-containing protein